MMRLLVRFCFSIPPDPYETDFCPLLRIPKIFFTNRRLSDMEDGKEEEMGVS
jgi:hypothetical protein